MIERASHSWTGIDFVDGDAESMPMAEIDPWNPVESHTSPTIPDSSLSKHENFEAIDQTSWSVGDLDDHELDDPWSEEDVPKWAEPDPTADASSDLNEELYPPDNTVTDLTRELKIGEFLTRVVPCTERQRMRCHELLSAATVGRLRRLIPWLRERAWCGAKLELYLEFRTYWELPINLRWWETFHWNYREGAWIPRYTQTTLTFHHASELVEVRGHCAPADVIDRSWFEDWENYAAWEAGVQSFASFAVFRAGVPNGQDWRDLLFPRDQRRALEIEQCEDATFAPFMIPSLIRQYGCPHTLDGAADLLSDLNDLARRNAATLGGDRTQAWQEIMAHFRRT